MTRYYYSFIFSSFYLMYIVFFIDVGGWDSWCSLPKLSFSCCANDNSSWTSELKEENIQHIFFIYIFKSHLCLSLLSLFLFSDFNFLFPFKKCPSQPDRQKRGDHRKENQIKQQTKWRVSDWKHIADFSPRRTGLTCRSPHQRRYTFLVKLLQPQVP